MPKSATTEAQKARRQRVIDAGLALLADRDVERLTAVFHRSVRAFSRQPQLARLIATLETSSDPFAREVLARLGEATTGVYTAAMHDVDPARAYAIVRVVDAVLASVLRSW